MRPLLRLLGAALLATTLLPASAQSDNYTATRGGLFGWDRYDEREDNGPLSRRNQMRLDALVIGSALSVALWEGTDSRAGRIAWQSVDAMATTALATETMKRVFQRARPAEEANPNDWFAGSQHASFPSGETAMMAAAVTPVILALQDEHPSVWALAALPVYMGAARMASQGHWLSDVLVGGAVGAVGGWYAAQRQQHRDDGLPEEPCRHGFGLRQRLVPHRRCRRGSLGRLPADHRPI